MAQATRCPFCGGADTAMVNFPGAPMPALRCRDCDGAEYVDSLTPARLSMTVTAFRRDEWSRAAKAMYARGRNDLGHMLSVAAALPELDIRRYDEVNDVYRRWLVFDLPKA